jgi:hypothetical protein
MSKLGAVLGLCLGAALLAGCESQQGPRGGCCGYAARVDVPAGACASFDGGSAAAGDGGSGDTGCAASLECEQACADYGSRTSCVQSLKTDIECNVVGVCCRDAWEGLQCTSGCQSSRPPAEAQEVAERVRAYLQNQWPQVVQPRSPGADCTCWFD